MVGGTIFEGARAVGDGDVAVVRGNGDGGLGGQGDIPDS